MLYPAGMTLDELNALPSPEAAATFLRCCNSSLWADVMDALRPFRSKPLLLKEARKAWAMLSDDDWREAFHRATAEGATQALTDALAEYESRFGFPFVASDAGRSPADVHARLRNDPETELGLAAEEQAKITQGCLETLISS
jgi:hypothetical protein